MNDEQMQTVLRLIKGLCDCLANKNARRVPIVVDHYMKEFTSIKEEQ